MLEVVSTDGKLCIANPGRRIQALYQLETRWVAASSSKYLRGGHSGLLRLEQSAEEDTGEGIEHCQTAVGGYLVRRSSMYATT